MAITNKEKQPRFRKKRELKKYKDQVFKECQTGVGFRHRQEAPKELLAHLDKAASLPSGWNEEDLERAWTRVYQLRYDYTHPQDDLRKDVEDGAGLTEVFYNWPELFQKLRSDTQSRKRPLIH